MSKLLLGKPVAADIEKNLSCIVQAMEKPPCLCIVREGDRAADASYERSAVKRCEKVGISVVLKHVTEDMPHDEFKRLFDSINSDKEISGILVLRPFNNSQNEQYACSSISPDKDIDCMSPASLGRVFTDNAQFFPCTAEAVIKALEFYEIPIAGRNAVVMGRSMVIGKPLAMMLLKKDATVTICHSKTQDVKSITKTADILICAVGKAKYIDSSYIKEGAVVIDVGINTDENGNLCGDADQESVQGKSAALTPVPGGIGAITSWILPEHLVKAAKENNKNE